MDKEFYFFIYAHPALGDCAHITEKESEKLQKLILSNSSPSKKELMILVPNAFKRMREKIGENYWTIEDIRRYWWVFHNKIIDNGESGYEYATEEQKEICKVKFWRIIEIKDKVITGKNEKIRKIIKAFNYRDIKLNKGDYITTHKMHVIEKITPEDYQKYG